jgi:hypothetical protein
MLTRTIFILALCHAPQAFSASEGISIGLGTDYLPLGKVEFGNPIQNSYDFYDNMFVETGFYYNFNTGFRIGGLLTLFSRNINPGGNSSSDISSWGVGALGDYEYSISESGSTNLVLGIDSGYSKFKDSNDFAKRTDNSYWVAAFGGLRYFFNTRYFLEIDYRMKWQEFSLAGNPVDKSFDFSGSSLRLALGYGFFSHQNNPGE